MRINFVLRYASLRGGTRVVAIYADYLRQRGHEVRVVSRQRRPLSLRMRARALLRGRLLPARRPHGPSHFDELGLDWRIIEHDGPLTERDIPPADITIATWWETAEWVASLGPTRGTKVYFCQHYETHEGQPVDRVRATYRLPMHQVCVSNWVRDQVQQDAGHADQVVVPNAVDREAFATPPRGKQPVPTVGFMYSSATYKGVDTITEALRLARAELPTLRALCFGARPPIERVPLPDWVEMEVNPPQSRIPELYASCDAWLFASRREGYGLPLLEAMASRTPVIATPAGAAPELVGSDRGVLVPHDDPGAMARAIVEIAGMDDPTWRRLSERAHAQTVTMSWRDAAERFEAALLDAHHAAERTEARPA
ncbi:MAG: glycosyltransferase family 4 protein [Phycisphaerales bacterium]